jgi:L-ascorbate metabolism protein UlaG (beta-lactamase superfamily)
MDIRLLPLLGYMLAASVCLALAACTVVNQPMFGKPPRGDRLDRIQGSPNYRDGKFQNVVPTAKFSTDTSFISVIWSGMFDRAERLKPDSPIPAVKTDVKALASSGRDALVWLGHSSWFIQVRGQRILVDPVFSDYAAPFSFLNKAFPGTNIYEAEDMPEIGCVLISHDHWDHLDYPTMMALQSKVKQVICPLGIGACFEHWGYPKEKIHEGDWYDRIVPAEDLIVHVMPARHYSGRLFRENQTLWAGFVLETPDQKIFYSGDSGYGPHFLDIGKAFNGFDLALLDCGQYDPRWANIHMTPEEASRAAMDLGAKSMIPAHVGRFAIARHPWDEPFKRLTKADRDTPYRPLTPKIGEPVILNGRQSQFSSWWLAEDKF